MAQAEQILRRSLHKIAAEQNYTDPDFKISPVSTEGANYTSLLFAATISSKDKDDLNLFAKVAAVGEKMRSQAPMKVFDTERIFYTELLQEYRQLEEKHGVPEQHRLKVPKLYDCSPTLYEETVVMENLSTKGYQLHDRFQSVTWEYAVAAFTELAKFHALSVAFKRENPEEFQKLSDEFKFQWVGIEAEMKPFMEMAIQRAISATREENREKLMAYMGQSQGMESFMKYYLPGDNPLFRHGDFRPSNILHKENEDGTVDIIPVDYQTIQCGPPIIDLLYFIFLGTDKKFRDKYFDKLLEHYYSELSAALSRLGLDPEETYSKKNFDDDLKENLCYGIMIGLSVLALVTVEVADAPDVNGDLDISSFQGIKAGSSFADRLNGIIDNFVEWGLL